VPAVEIEIVTRAPTGSGRGNTANPRLAIIIDDLGSDRAAAEAIFAAALPSDYFRFASHEHSVEIATESASARFSGHAPSADAIGRERNA